ncbi:MAG: glycosyltransferase [Polyangiaceae bacterium]|nr:glycosyltransferase [Polyangiaceae bacterium]
MTIAHSLFWIVSVLALGSLAALVVVQFTASLAIRRARRSAIAQRAQLPGVSILKPIKGADVSLEANLAAFARQDYPKFELLLGIEDPSDPAIPVVRRFQRNHPALQVRVLIGAPAIGLNPKVNNLAFMSRQAKHELWLISDADVVPEADYLRRMVSEWDGEKAGLVHSNLVGAGERTLGASFESIHMNTFVASMIWGAAFARHNCVIGKSVLFHKQLLQKMGGWRAVENVLAEDYMLGQLARDHGVGVKLCMQPLEVRNEERTLESFINRHVRWAQMRRRVSLKAYVCESTSNPIAWLFWVWVAASFGAPVSFGHLVSLSAIFVSVKCLSDQAMARSLRRGGLAFRQFLLIPVKDLLIAGVWFVGLFKRSVNWRGNIILIGPGSQLSRPAKESLAADPA